MTAEILRAFLRVGSAAHEAALSLAHGAPIAEHKPQYKAQERYHRPVEHLGPSCSWVSHGTGLRVEIRGCGGLGCVIYA